MDLTIIIINFNTSNYTIECLKSVFKQTSKSITFEIIVIDNNSTSHEVQFLEESLTQFSNITLVKNNKNVGFGGGNMVGAEKAKGKYIAFVNNDTILLNDCFNLIISAMESNQNYGVCGPQAFKVNGNILPTLDHFTSPLKELFGRSFLEFINKEKYPKRKRAYREHQRGQFVSGSFMVLRKEDFDRIGGFDTAIFLYQEETDICKRLLKINKYAYLIPEAKFLHHHGASTKKSIAIKTELKLSTLYVIKKHYGWLAHKLILFFFTTKYFMRSFFKPKYWKIFKVLAKGGKLHHSLLDK